MSYVSVDRPASWTTTHRDKICRDVNAARVASHLHAKLVRAILTFLQQPVAKKVFASMKDDRDPTQRNIFDEFVADLEAKNKAEGKAEGLREAVRAVVKTREFLLTKKELSRIDACGDLKLLKVWHSRAVSAPKKADVFRD